MITQSCSNYSLKYLPLTYTNLAFNIGPLLTAVLSYIIFKKGLSVIDSIILVVSFLGVGILIDSFINSDTPADSSTN